MGPVVAAVSLMSSLSSPPGIGSITSRQDLSKIEGLEIHEDTHPDDPVVGEGFADFNIETTARLSGKPSKPVLEQG